MKKKTQEEFLNDCLKVHGNRYDYSLAKYSGAHKKVEIICGVHGVFEQIPANHINQARGCPHCALETTLSHTRKDLDYHLKSLIDTHGDKYDYANFVYKNTKTKSKVTCSCGKTFSVSIEKLKSGRGCPHCSKSGFKPEKPCYLYVHALDDDYLKVGISTSPKERLTKIKLGYEGEIKPLYKAHFKTSKDALEAEKAIKCKFTRSTLPENKMKDGFTEVFPKQVIGEILKEICTLCDIYDAQLSSF